MKTEDRKTEEIGKSLEWTKKREGTYGQNHRLKGDIITHRTEILDIGKYSENLYINTRISRRNTQISECK